MELAEIRKRAMYDPQSLSKSEWEQIHKAAFTVPKKEFFDDDAAKVDPGLLSKRKEKNWW